MSYHNRTVFVWVFQTPVLGAHCFTKPIVKLTMRSCCKGQFPTNLKFQTDAYSPRCVEDFQVSNGFKPSFNLSSTLYTSNCFFDLYAWKTHPRWYLDVAFVKNVHYGTNQTYTQDIHILQHIWKLFGKFVKLPHISTAAWYEASFPGQQVPFSGGSSGVRSNSFIDWSIKWFDWLIDLTVLSWLFGFDTRILSCLGLDGNQPFFCTHLVTGTCIATTVGLRLGILWAGYPP